MVVVGVVGVVCEPRTPTVIVTVAPLRARAPAAGLCFSTNPTCVGSVVAADTIFGVNPAPPSVAAACV